MKIRKRILNLIILSIFALVLVACNNTTTNKYEITFKDEDGTVLKVEEFSYGEMPVYTGS
ncbi:hypothetical protein IY230_05685, partial [Acholeplasma laidlawii]|nr:hypothetical protein [Acholeplasma laidlawii]